MNIAERIHNIANKANVPYAMINQIVNSTYGKSTMSIEDKLNLLEKEYGIQ